MENINITKLQVVTKDYMPTDGEHYIIVKTGLGGYNEYGIINHKDVGKDGKLKRQLNGLQMMLSKTVADLIDLKEKCIKVDRLEENGIKREVAALMVNLGKTQAETESIMALLHRQH